MDSIGPRAHQDNSLLGEAQIACAVVLRFRFPPSTLCAFNAVDPVPVPALSS